MFLGIYAKFPVPASMSVSICIIKNYDDGETKVPDAGGPVIFRQGGYHTKMSVLKSLQQKRRKYLRLLLIRMPAKGQHPGYNTHSF
jgi:hypothetical protein